MTTTTQDVINFVGTQGQVLQTNIHLLLGTEGGTH